MLVGKKTRGGFGGAHSKGNWKGSILGLFVKNFLKLSEKNPL